MSLSCPSRAGARLGIAALAGLFATLTASAADAYCRTSACGDSVGARCTPAMASDCGTALHWPTSCVGFSVQEDASIEVGLAATTATVRAAFDAWENVDCGGGEHPSITAQDLGAVACSQAEYDADTKNANLIVFRDSGWAYSQSALALTTVTYALDTGEIRDADIELNSQSAHFTTGDGAVQVDLASILTHETGHFLGLAHSPVADATMEEEYPPKSTELRSLEADDRAAICDAYPPSSTRPCEPTPVNGLGDTCGEPSGDGGADDGCSASVAGDRGGAGAAGMIGVAVAIWVTGRSAASWRHRLRRVVARRRRKRDVRRKGG